MFADLLVHTVEVYARSGRVDRFGQPVDSNPGQQGGTVLATYPCRAYLKSGGLNFEERQRDVFERAWEMFTELDADIREDDSVRVVAADASVLVNKCIIKDVETVYDGTGPHHKEYALWEQDGPNPRRVP